MTNTKKIVITTESREIFIVRRSAEFAVRGYCETCAAETELLTLDAATVAANKSTRELIRQIESGAVHSIEAASGHLLVCVASLLENGNFLKAAN